MLREAESGQSIIGTFKYPAPQSKGRPSSYPTETMRLISAVSQKAPTPENEEKVQLWGIRFGLEMYPVVAILPFMQVMYLETSEAVSWSVAQLVKTE